MKPQDFAKEMQKYNKERNIENAQKLVEIQVCMQNHYHKHCAFLWLFLLGGTVIVWWIAQIYHTAFPLRFLSYVVVSILASIFWRSPRQYEEPDFGYNSVDFLFPMVLWPIMAAIETSAAIIWYITRCHEIKKWRKDPIALVDGNAQNKMST